MPVPNYRKPIKDSYFITATLKPSFYTKNAKEQYDTTKVLIKQILSPYCSDLELVPELTKDCNIHYHGWLVIQHEHDLDYIKDRIKQLGYCKIDKITKDTEDRVFTYMLKDTKRTDRLLGTTINRIRYTKKKNNNISNNNTTNNNILGTINFDDDNIISRNYLDYTEIDIPI